MAASDQRDEVIIKLKAHIRELEAENAALKEYKVRYGKVIGNNLTRIAELKDNNAQLREALGAVDEELKLAVTEIDNTEYPRTVAEDRITAVCALIEAALKGV